VFDQRQLSREEQPAFLAIQNAMVENPPKSLRFQYTGKDGKQNDRHVEPYELDTTDKGSLLKAHDIDADQTRQFYLARMSSVAQGGPFNARHPIKIPL